MPSSKLFVSQQRESHGATQHHRYIQNMPLTLEAFSCSYVPFEIGALDARIISAYRWPGRYKRFKSCCVIMPIIVTKLSLCKIKPAVFKTHVPIQSKCRPKGSPYRINCCGCVRIPPKLPPFVVNRSMIKPKRIQPSVTGPLVRHNDATCANKAGYCSLERLRRAI